MGVRLYPQTNKAQNLETLAGVPIGTMDKLKAIQAQFAHDPYGEAAYNAVYGNLNGNLGNLDCLLANGWGKTVCNTLENMGFDPNSGSCNDFEKCVAILRAHFDYKRIPHDEMTLRLFVLASEGLIWG